MRTRSATCWVAVVLLLGALVGACTGSGTDESEGPAESTTSSSDASDGVVDPLPEDTLAAVCLTESDDEPMETELCTVDLTGARTLLGVSVDGGEAIALSPDRTTIAAIVDGELQLASVDGSELETTGVTGAAPEWIDDQTVGLVADGAGEIVAVDSQSLGVEPLADLTGLTEAEGFVVESFAFLAAEGRLVASLYADGGAEGPDEDDLWALANLNLDSMEPDFLVDPSSTSIGYPDWSPDGRLAAIMHLDLHLVDPATGETQRVSSPQHVASTPTWSFDGERIAWLANGVGSPIGPAILVYADSADVPFELIPIVGNEDRPLDRFPAFPDW